MSSSDRDNRSRLIFDLSFFASRLENNGFTIDKQPVSIEKGLLKGINIKQSYSPFDNGVLSKIGRYYTMESQILLSDASIVSGELRKRL
ncbi:MAG: hypothetical protein ACP5OE_10120 [Thermodesulfobium sp.]